MNAKSPTTVRNNTTSTLTHSVEDHVQAVVYVGHPVPETKEVKTILDVALVYLAEHLVTLQTTEPVDPSVLAIRRRRVRHGKDEASWGLFATRLRQQYTFLQSHVIHGRAQQQQSRFGQQTERCRHTGLHYGERGRRFFFLSLII